MKPGSIRWLLLCWFSALFIVVLLALSVSVWLFIRNEWILAIDLELEVRVAAVATDFRSSELPRRPPMSGWRRIAPNSEAAEEATDLRRPRPPWFPRGSPGQRTISISDDTLTSLREAQAGAMYYIIWSRLGEELTRSPDAPPMALPVMDSRGAKSIKRTRELQRELVQRNEWGDTVVVGVSLATLEKEQERLAMLLATTSAAILFVALGVAWRLITQSLRPVKDISTAAERISAGNLTERIPVPPRTNELSGLAVVLNSTFTRLDSAFSELRKFTADASHELRTPPAVIITEAQGALNRPRSPSEYRQSLTICLDAAQEMRRITEMLLTLAHLDQGDRTLLHEPVDLAALAGRCLETMAPLAEREGVLMEAALLPAPVNGNPGQLLQVMTNLVDNAIHYNRRGGKVTVSTSAGATEVELQVEDTGIGIPEDDHARIFQRFYRVDKSRSNAAGRSGLGLAIVHAIAKAHGGTVSVASEIDRGSTFVVRLPRELKTESLTAGASRGVCGSHT